MISKPNGEFFEGYGHGKVILVGEHAVVYGYPAISTAIDRGVSARIRPRLGPSSSSSVRRNDRVEAAIRAILPEYGYQVELESTLPVGRGLGASAALAAALVRADAARRGELALFTTLHERAFAVERCFHGTPSGADHAVSLLGCTLRFRRGESLEVRPLPPLGFALVVLDTEVPKDTAQMVRAVASRRPAVDPWLARIGALAEAAESALDDIDALGEIFDENHRCLSEIGVSNPSLDSLAAWARAEGATGAKLSGSGGGGVVIALSRDPETMVEKAARKGMNAMIAAPADGGADRCRGGSSQQGALASC